MTWKVFTPKPTAEFIIESEHEIIATTPNASKDDKDNAHLISAAPELLEACEKALEYLAYFGDHSDTDSELETLLKTAIKKATNT